MPDPDKLLRTLRQAAQTFRTTPGRRGRVVFLDRAEDLLVVGDLHGHFENFRQALLRAELGKRPNRHLVLQEVVHGPYRYPGGGDKSHQLLDLIAALKCQFPRQVHFLLGNHELSQWTDRRIGKNDEDLNDLFRQGVGTAYGPQADQVYAAYRELLGAAPLAIKTPNRVFVSHSLPSAMSLTSTFLAGLEKEEAAEADWLAGGCIHAIVWGRDTRAETAAAFLNHVDADLLITGHIPSDGGFAVPNDRQIILDAMGSPAGYCLFPADRPLTHGELVGCIRTF
jgi:hypothetical protein